MHVTILGSAAGGGFPQWNCACENCRRLRAGTLHGKPRTQVQVAISLGRDSWCLLNASPDLRLQIETTPSLHPSLVGARNQPRSSPISAVILTSGDLDNTLGLLLLREFQPFEVLATPSIQHVLTQGNTFFKMLQRVDPQVVWRDMALGKGFKVQGTDAESAIRCEAIPLPGGYPEYVSDEDRAHLPASEALVALEIQAAHGGEKMIYCPALPELSDDLLARFAACDLLLLDGTFWSDDELMRVMGGKRTAQSMGHLPIADAEGSLERLRSLTRPRKVYIHINNTNPILDEDSTEFQQVTAAGWSVACDGMQLEI